MLMFILGVIFVIPVCFLNVVSWWLVQLVISIMGFFFMLCINMGMCYENMSYMFGYDLLSYGLVMLSFWICGLMIMASGLVYNGKCYYNLFMVFVMLLLLMLICAFLSMSMLSFYIFFEGSLIPTLMLILGWGYQPERIRAGIYLLFYTLFASLPLLVGLLLLNNNLGSLNFCVFYEYKEFNVFMYLCLIFAFLVKMPMFLVHLWLPSAHVEAPISGSMILAGVLLKLGGYGLIRLLNIMLLCCVSYSFIWIGVSLVGGVLIGLVCLRQVDLKSMIAYSSVAHMGMVLSGIMVYNMVGVGGSYLMMIAHGLCSSGYFVFQMFLYERIGNPNLLIYKGLMGIMPNLSLWWILLWSSKMAAPPSLNFLAENMLIKKMMSWNVLSFLLISLMTFFGAAENLFLYSYNPQGKEILLALWSYYLWLFSGIFFNIFNYLLLYSLFLRGYFFFFL
uniref:NADH-ubiquinone oxidoreductase chain 4 n=1 Tax=Xenogryllus marmoratus TaxID=323499 RepID=A0A7L9QDW8_9ORTH|nr:NADH dehydrogenase subunit 4 [Xenogryllus marmoratus]